MALLDESESRAFSSFLDSFASTSAPSRSNSFSAAPPVPPPPSFGYSTNYTQLHVPSDSGGYRSAEPGTRYGRMPIPNGGADTVLPAYEHHYARDHPYHQTVLPESLPPVAPALPRLVHSTSVSASNPPRGLQEEHPDLVKQRKLQYAQELQNWIAQSQTMPRSQDVRDSSPSPPKRRKSSGEDAGSQDRQDMEKREDTIAMMLEAERRAGYAYGKTINAAITRETAQPRFSPPEPGPSLSSSHDDKVSPPMEVPIPHSNRRSSSSQAAATLASLPPLPFEFEAPASAKTAAPVTAKRKAAPTAKASSAKASRPRGSLTRAPVPPPPVSLDPETADSTLASVSPFPFETPVNIPRIPHSTRSRLARSRHRSSSTRSNETSTSTLSFPNTGGAEKPALLTVEQKKANHIASEQKRRVAIKKGYDGLCSVVPVLREAVQEFEERVLRLTEMGAATSGKKKKGRGKSATNYTAEAGGAKIGALLGGINVGGEKIDGRAGPKSEAVVLSKTVDHVRQLLSNRSDLLERLAQAYTRAEEQGIAVPLAEAHEWDEPWDGDSENDESGRAGNGQEDEEMWEDADE
ncbi:uncharacterized protein JCM15063_004585 [Sporobolomyces koalae]|uniref:uncharacterized protein n=1 Tax=Sporobolomyces koalae TaxID=500713 RepID=UPI003177B19F